jgi:hypothetical protein
VAEHGRVPADAAAQGGAVLDEPGNEPGLAAVGRGNADLAVALLAGVDAVCA